MKTVEREAAIAPIALNPEFRSACEFSDVWCE
jgi:hypothetical protein